MIDNKEPISDKNKIPKGVRIYIYVLNILMIIACSYVTYANIDNLGIYVLIPVFLVAGAFVSYYLKVGHRKMEPITLLIVAVILSIKSLCEFFFK